MTCFVHTPDLCSAGANGAKPTAEEAQAALPPELQHCDAEMVEKITKEILQTGDPVTFDVSACMCICACMCLYQCKSNQVLDCMVSIACFSSSVVMSWRCDICVSVAERMSRFVSSAISAAFRMPARCSHVSCTHILHALTDEFSLTAPAAALQFT